MPKFKDSSSNSKKITKEKKNVKNTINYLAKNALQTQKNPR